MKVKMAGGSNLVSRAFSSTFKMAARREKALAKVVSFAAVIRVVTQCSSTGEEHCVTTRITAAKETMAKADKISKNLGDLYHVTF